MKILLCYDGSPDARAAVELVGELYAGSSAVVLTVRDGFSEVLARSADRLTGASLNFEQIDADCERAARAQADEGVALARAAGLDAAPCVVERGGTIWETILEQADRQHADAIVLGSRGLTGIRSMLLGSVSHAVLQHADRPVVVVPGSSVARERAARLHRHASGPST